MSPELSAQTASRRRPTALTMPSWLPAFLFMIAVVAEILSMILMTVYRYRNQGLEPALFDFSRTANLLGLLVTVPFVLLFMVLASARRQQLTGLATAAATMSCAGLVLLTLPPLMPAADRDYLYAGYLAFKVVELAIFVAMVRRGRRPWWRRALRALSLSIIFAGGVLLLVIATLLLNPIASSIEPERPQDFDAAVILGAAVWSKDRPSPVLRERINTGYDLLKNGMVQFLVLTGGNAPHELPEAEVARRELLKRGVDPTRIVIETHTGSTLEQILFIREQLIAKQRWSSFIIVSDQFHLARALEICRFNGIDASGVSSESPLGPQNLVLYHLRESAALILYWMFGI